jgi:hypothetical protein
MALLSTEGGSILSYLTQHPMRTSLGLSVVAGVLGFLAIVRWYIKQPGAGNVSLEYLTALVLLVTNFKWILPNLRLNFFRTQDSLWYIR